SAARWHACRPPHRALTGAHANSGTDRRVRSKADRDDPRVGLIAALGRDTADRVFARAVRTYPEFTLVRAASRPALENIQMTNDECCALLFNRHSEIRHSHA